MKILGWDLSLNKYQDIKQEVEEITEDNVKEQLESLSDKDQLRIMMEVMEKANYGASTDSVEIPTEAGRSSQPDNASSLVPNVNAPINTDFPFHVLPVLDNLSVYNRHVSYAVDNIQTLANTDFNISFSDNVPDAQQAEMKDYINSRIDGWYEFSDGVNGLKNDLFAQLSTFGCISSERVIEDDLSGIKKIVRVDPADVRFTYDQKEDEFLPVQETSGFQFASSLGLGYVNLNPVTYSYIALRRYQNTPYGVPPFVSALEDLITEADMLVNFKNMMKRVGMLGFLSVILKAPKAKSGESDKSYANRLNAFLKQEKPKAEAMYAKGVALGFKDTHEFNVEANNMNVKGAEGLIDIVKMLIYSGLKQDPNMHGENQATTETFGKVILAKMSKQATNYQKAVASFLEICILQELVLAGFNPGTVTVKFDRPMINDQAKEEDAKQKKFNRLKGEYDQGLISQTTFAQDMNRDEPDQEGPRTAIVEEPTAEAEDGTEETIENSMELIGFLKYKLRAHLPNFNYHIPDNCDIEEVNSFVDTTDFNDPVITKIVKEYVANINKTFGKAVDKASRNLQEKTKLWNQATTLQQVQSDVLISLLKDWESSFSNKITPEVTRKVKETYRHYRSDKEIFSLSAKHKGTSFEDDIPDADFSVGDFRTIEYLQKIDDVWLGKFITDDDTIRRINIWVEDQFESGSLTVGRNSTTLKKFIDEFDSVVNLENWKIRRIIETTANKGRNYGSINYLNQVGVEQFVVIEVNDSRTCPYCQHMDGRTFSVEIAQDKIRKANESGIDELAEITPFATTLKIEEFRNLGTTDLQAMGFDSPPYHPHCRGRVAAI